MSEWSPTLVGEGEGVRVGSQVDPLMQQKRENERNAGINEEWEDPIVSELRDVNEAELLSGKRRGKE